MITPMRVDSAASAAFETTSEHGLGNSGSFRTCLKKKKPTQKLMFMLNHWSSKILT